MQDFGWGKSKRSCCLGKKKKKSMGEREDCEATENVALDIWGICLSKTIKIKRKSWGCVHTGQTFCSLEIFVFQNDFPQGCPSLAGFRFSEGCPRRAEPLSSPPLSTNPSPPPTHARRVPAHPGLSVPLIIPVSWAKRAPPPRLWCPVPPESC